MTAIHAPRCVPVRVVAAVALALAALMVACGESGPPSPNYLDEARGDAGHGRELIRAYGCQTCHVVPGVSGGAGRVGPELDGIARQTYIAGVLENSPLNMVRWVRDPESINPNTLMPVLGVSETEAHDIVAYLATLD